MLMALWFTRWADVRPDVLAEEEAILALSCAAWLACWDGRYGLLFNLLEEEPRNTDW